MNDLCGKFLATFEIQKDGNKKLVDLAIEFIGTKQFHPYLAFNSLKAKIGVGAKYLLHVSAIPDNDWLGMKTLADFNDTVQIDK